MLLHSDVCVALYNDNLPFPKVKLSKPQRNHQTPLLCIIVKPICVLTTRPLPTQSHPYTFNSGPQLPNQHTQGRRQRSKNPGTPTPTPGPRTRQHRNRTSRRRYKSACRRRVGGNHHVRGYRQHISLRRRCCRVIPNPGSGVRIGPNSPRTCRAQGATRYVPYVVGGADCGRGATEAGGVEGGARGVGGSAATVGLPSLDSVG